MTTFLHDLRYSFRSFRKTPGFTFVVVLTLSLGIGANTAIFSVINGVLLRPLPYRNAESAVLIWQNNTRSGTEREDVSPANFLDWRDQNQSFERMAAIEPFSHDMTGSGEPEMFRSWVVTEGFFEILGTSAMLGRTFLPEEFKPGSERVVVIGYGLWQRRFGADPNLVGQKLTLRGQPYTVVGVMPQAFQFPAEREVWAPRVPRESDAQMRGATFLTVIGRLKPGVTIEQAQSEMTSIAARLSEAYPEANGGVGAGLVPLREQLVGQVRPALVVLLCAVGFVLLIACANVANLLLVRGAERRRELAIRSALGAVRRRILRQLLTESLVLSLMGGGVGVLLAYWGSDLILALSPGSLPRAAEVGIDARVLLFSVAVSVLTALIIGLIPSFQLSKIDLQEVLKEGGRTNTAARERFSLRNVLIVSEIALALVLLIGAGLLVRSFVQLLKVDPGFKSDKVLALQVQLGRHYQKPEQRTAFLEQTLERIRSLPQVRSASAVSYLPFDQADVGASFTVEGRPTPPAGEEFPAHYTISTTDYFNTLSIPVLRGRVFTEDDRADAPRVVLINDALARKYFAGEDPVGKRIKVLFGRETVAEIVGVVGDLRYGGLDADARPEIFVPYKQNTYGSMSFVVRTAGDPLSVAQDVKNQVWSVNRDLAFARTTTLDELVSASLQERRFTLVLTSAFALLALLLSGVGIYGLISYTTSLRTHEIGVRMALGAERNDIMRLILRQSMTLTVAGIALGVIGALLLTRFLQSMLFGVSPTDPATFILLSLVLMTVALLASIVPARRAMRVDPMVALRYE